MPFLKVFIRVLSLARAERGLCFFLALAAIGVAAAQIFEPILFGRVIDALAKEGEFTRYVLIWIALGLSNASLSIFLSIAADRLAHRQRLRAMGLAFERSISLPPHSPVLQSSGRVVRTIIAGSEQVFHISLSFFRENIIALASVIILIPMAFLIQPSLAYALFSLAFVYVSCNWFVIRRSHSRQLLVELKHQDLAARLLDVISNVTVVRSFTRVVHEAQLFGEKMSEVLKEQYPVLTYWGILNVITRLSSMVAMVTIVAIGSHLVHSGQVSGGQVVTFVGFSTLLIARLDQLSSFINRIVGQMPAVKNLFDLINHQEGRHSSQPRKWTNDIRGQVTFANVTFKYGANAQGVYNLDFDVMPGQTVALVGPSGAGKTTCLALLQRIHSPQSGQVLIDGQDIQTLSVESLCGAIATVFQEPGLFNRSIFDNILVGRPTATREQVIAAAERAAAHDFIVEHPGGYDFLVGERGQALSTGERQRIAIARAILKNAPILVLDEATSALDNETEKRIQSAMDQLRKGKTTFMIAHRLSTVLAADRILVLASGRIVQSGTFAELSTTPGLFQRLLRSGQMEKADAQAQITL